MMSLIISSAITPEFRSTGLDLTTSYRRLSLARVTKNAPFLCMRLKSRKKSSYPISIR